MDCHEPDLQRWLFFRRQLPQGELQTVQGGGHWVVSPEIERGRVHGLLAELRSF